MYMILVQLEIKCVIWKTTLPNVFMMAMIAVQNQGMINLMGEKEKVLLLIPICVLVYQVFLLLCLPSPARNRVSISRVFNSFSLSELFYASNSLRCTESGYSLYVKW